MHILKNSKSQSQVIATILLILIALGLIVIISSFAINFTNKRLSEADCFDFTGKIEFRNNIKYTCYDVPDPPDEFLADIMRVQVHIGDITEEIKGFKISVSMEGSSESFDIIDNENENPQIEMYVQLTGDDTGLLKIPQKNAEKTYSLYLSEKIKPDSLSIYPILEDGKTCSASDTLRFIDNCE